MPATETMPIEEAEELLAELDEEEALDEVRRYHRETARRIWPRGATLYCKRCGREQTATTIEMAACLGRGLPTCCGRQMWIGDAEGEGLGARGWEN